MAKITSTLLSNSITNNDISTTAAIDVGKLKHQRVHTFSPHDAYGYDVPVYIVVGGGSITNVSVVRTNIDHAITITVNIRKNGESILTTPITLDDSQDEYEVVQGLISTSTIQQGDTISVDLNYNLTPTYIDELQGILVQIVTVEESE